MPEFLSITTFLVLKREAGVNLGTQTLWEVRGISKESEHCFPQKSIESIFSHVPLKPFMIAVSMH